MDGEKKFFSINLSFFLMFLFWSIINSLDPDVLIL